EAWPLGFPHSRTYFPHGIQPLSERRGKNSAAAGLEARRPAAGARRRSMGLTNQQRISLQSLSRKSEAGSQEAAANGLLRLCLIFLSCAFAQAQTYDLAWSPDNKIIALAGFREVRLIDPTTKQQLGALEGAADAVRAMSFSK